MVRWRHGPDSVLRPARRCGSFSPDLQGRADARSAKRSIRNTRNGATTTSSSSTATSPAALAASSSTISTRAAFERCFDLTQSVGNAFTKAYLPVLAKRRDVPTANANVISGLPPGSLRRVQSGLGPRHAVRPAIGRPHRINPDVDAADRQMALRLAAGSWHTGSRTLRSVPQAAGVGLSKLPKSASGNQVARWRGNACWPLRDVPADRRAGPVRDGPAAMAPRTATLSR